MIIYEIPLDLHVPKPNICMLLTVFVTNIVLHWVVFYTNTSFSCFILLHPTLYLEGCLLK